MDKDILNTNARHSGMTVPEGYFDDFVKQMTERIDAMPMPGEQQGAILEAPRTLWQKIRPYVYLAAMFAGVWLMMNIFNHISPANTSLQIEQNPVLTAALQNDQFVDEYILDNYDGDYIMDEMNETGHALEIVPVDQDTTL